MTSEQNEGSEDMVVVFNRQEIKFSDGGLMKIETSIGPTDYEGLGRKFEPSYMPWHRCLLKLVTAIPEWLLRTVQRCKSALLASFGIFNFYKRVMGFRFARLETHAVASEPSIGLHTESPGYVNCCTACLLVCMLPCFVPYAACILLGAVLFSIVDLLMTLCCCYRVCMDFQNQAQSLTCKIGDDSMEIPIVEGTGTMGGLHRLGNGIGFQTTGPDEAAMHALGFTEPMATEIWAREEYAISIHGQVDRMQVAEWSLQATTRAVRDPTVLKICISYRQQDHRPTDFGIPQRKLPVQDWVRCVNHLAKKARVFGFYRVMFWWDQVLSVRNRLGLLDIEGTPWALIGLEPYLHYPVAVVMPTEGRLGMVAFSPITLDAANRLWPSMEVICGMCGMGLMGGDPLVDGILSNLGRSPLEHTPQIADHADVEAVQPDVYDAWRKLMRSGINSDGAMNIGLGQVGGCMLPAELARMRVAAITLATKQYRKLAHVPEEASVIRRWAEGVVSGLIKHQNIMSPDLRPQAELEQTELEKDACIKKALTAMSVSGPVDYFEVQHFRDYENAHKGHWNPWMDLAEPLGQVNSENALAMSGVDNDSIVMVFRMNVRTTRAYDAYPRGSEVCVMRWDEADTYGVFEVRSLYYLLLRQQGTSFRDGIPPTRILARCTMYGFENDDDINFWDITPSLFLDRSPMAPFDSISQRLCRLYALLVDNEIAELLGVPRGIDTEYFCQEGRRVIVLEAMGGAHRYICAPSEGPLRDGRRP